MIKKLIIVLGCALLLLVIAVGSAIWYAKPSEKLDLRYSEVPLADRALGMLKNLTTRLALSEADLNNIAKAYIAANPQYAPDVVVTGARFDLQGERVAARYNLKWKHRIAFDVVVDYRLQWRDPNLLAIVDEATWKGHALPNGYFDDIVIPIGQSLPKPLHIKAATLSGDQLLIEMKKPALSDLRDLLMRKIGLKAG